MKILKKNATTYETIKIILKSIMESQYFLKKNV